MSLSETARKEAQIKEINRQGAILDALVRFAHGDESALKELPLPIVKVAREIVETPPIDETTLPQVADGEKCPQCNSSAPGHRIGGVACVPATVTVRATHITNSATGEKITWTEFVPCDKPAEFAPSTDEADDAQYDD